LRDDQWTRIAPLLPGKAGDPGRSGRPGTLGATRDARGDPGRSAADNRLFLEAVLWIVRVGAPWRALPDGFGNWNSVFPHFRRWARSGVFDRVFQALSEDADFESVSVDGTIVRVHQHGTGARGGPTIRPSAVHAAA
jgi:transposase